MLSKGQTHPTSNLKSWVLSWVGQRNFHPQRSTYLALIDKWFHHVMRMGAIQFGQNMTSLNINYFAYLSFHFLIKNKLRKGGTVNLFCLYSLKSFLSKWYYFLSKFWWFILLHTQSRKHPLFVNSFLKLLCAKACLASAYKGKNGTGEIRIYFQFHRYVTMTERRFRPFEDYYCSWSGMHRFVVKIQRLIFSHYASK